MSAPQNITTSASGVAPGTLTVTSSTPTAADAAPAAVPPGTAPAAPTASPEAAKRTLEASLATLDDETRAYVLGEVAKARKEAGDARGAAKTKAADEARAELAQTIGKALGLVADDEQADPAKLTEQLTASQAQARTAAVELAVFRAAMAANADPVALLDSRSFLAKLADVDPADHAAVTTAVGEAVAANAAFAVAPARRVPAPNPALGSSAAGPPGIDEQIAAAKKAGDVKQWMHLENQKLAAPSR